MYYSFILFDSNMKLVFSKDFYCVRIISREFSKTIIFLFFNQKINQFFVCDPNVEFISDSHMFFNEMIGQK